MYKFNLETGKKGVYIHIYLGSMYVGSKQFSSVTEAVNFKNCF